MGQRQVSVMEKMDGAEMQGKQKSSQNYGNYG